MSLFSHLGYYLDHARSPALFEFVLTAKPALLMVSLYVGRTVYRLQDVMSRIASPGSG